MKGRILKISRCIQKTNTEKYSKFLNYLLSFSSKQLYSSVIIESSIRLFLQTRNKSLMQTISKSLNWVKQRSRKESVALSKESITKRTQHRA